MRQACNAKAQDQATRDAPRQAALALRDRENVLRLGEMVDADVQISRPGQAPYCQCQDLQFRFRGRQLGFSDAPLRREPGRQMRKLYSAIRSGSSASTLSRVALKLSSVCLGRP